MNNTELKIKGYQILSQYLGLVEMEKFISLIQQDKFDYTIWRKSLLTQESVEDISKAAMNERKFSLRKEL